jgi:hypothetical protein
MPQQRCLWMSPLPLSVEPHHVLLEPTSFCELIFRNTSNTVLCSSRMDSEFLIRHWTPNCLGLAAQKRIWINVRGGEMRNPKTWDVAKGGWRMIRKRCYKALDLEKVLVLRVHRVNPSGNKWNLVSWTDIWSFGASSFSVWVYENLYLIFDKGFSVCL